MTLLDSVGSRLAGLPVVDGLDVVGLALCIDGRVDESIIVSSVLGRLFILSYAEISSLTFEIKEYISFSVL